MISIKQTLIRRKAEFLSSRIKEDSTNRKEISNFIENISRGKKKEDIPIQDKSVSRIILMNKEILFKKFAFFKKEEKKCNLYVFAMH